jgi:hypothetical protein
MRVEVEWTGVEAGGPLWRDARCLYAYVDADAERLLYVGKADFQTVRQRLACPGKDDLFEYLRRELAVDAFRVVHGRPWLDEGRRLTSELLADVECVLILRLRPFGNVACTRSRISRPGLSVVCVGDWPFARRRFRDS